MNTAHWHYPESVGEDGDLYEGVTRTHYEAVTEYGRDDDYYIYVCYDLECLDDCDWFWIPDPVWRRND